MPQLVKRVIKGEYDFDKEEKYLDQVIMGNLSKNERIALVASKPHIFKRKMPSPHTEAQSLYNSSRTFRKNMSFS